MTKRVLQISSIFIYIIYAYFLVWQIFSSNAAFVYEQGNEYSETILPGFQIVLEGFVTAIVLLLFAILLYCHLYLVQKRAVIFSSFFAAAVLIINDPRSSMISFALVAFGLGIAFFELKKNI